MKTLKLLVVTLFLTSSLNGFAQDVENLNVEDISFASKLDYIDFEEDVLLYIDWLENNPLKHKDRKKVNAVVVAWLTGTPSVTISIHSYITTYTSKNKDFIVLFMAGWAQKALDNKDEKLSDLEGNMAGVNAILEYYAKGKEFDVKRDKKIEQLLEYKENGKLEEFILYQIKS